MTDASSHLSRRELLLAAASAPLASNALAKPPRPPAFLWGAATAGHQVEGNNVASDVWLLEQVKPTLFAEPSGDACDSLHRWPEDLDLVRSLGLNCYRFSIEWARIEPAEGQFSIAYLDHYRRIVDACRARGIGPLPTLSHFASPRWFAARGGWEVADAPQFFARFAERAIRHLGPGVTHALTFNEPNLQYLGRWNATPMSRAARDLAGAMLAAAAKAAGSERFSLQNGGDAEAMLEHLLASHRLARSAMKTVRGDLAIGLSLALPDDQAAGEGSLLERKRKEVYAPFFEAARDDEFIGVQTYGRTRIDANGTLAAPEGAERTQTGEEFYPAALGGAIAYAHAATGKPVFVTENGIATLDDTQRIRFLHGALESLAAQMRAGVPVLGYLHWSLLDNFEWFAGYGPRFGLVEVDRSSFRRTPKASAREYARLVREWRS